MTQSAVDRLITIMATLRAPEGGCPWDRKQNWRSIVPHTLEEAYEVADTIERGEDDERLCDELGDLLFQVIYYCQFAREEGRFEFHDVAEAIAAKIIRRHPHVFGDDHEWDATAQTKAWEHIKAKEREARAGTEGRSLGLLDDVPRGLPALTRGVKLQKRASRVGFDWQETVPVIAKVREELAELEEALAAGDPEHAAEEYGDLLFACANLGRHLKVDPEQTLRAANDKFERRFQGLEAVLAAQGRQPADCDFDTLEAAYQQAKTVDQTRSLHACGVNKYSAHESNVIPAYSSLNQRPIQGGYAMSLSAKTCTPCKGGTPPMSREDAKDQAREIPDWTLTGDPLRLYRAFKFKNFRESLAFVDKVGEMAEVQGHHPEFHFGWGHVELEIWTHKIKGLHENDFIFAAKVDALV